MAPRPIFYNNVLEVKTGSKSKEIAEVLASQTCKKIINHLAESKEASEKDLSDKLNLPYSAVYINLRTTQRGYTSFNEYIKDLIKKREFSCYKDYCNYLAKQKGFKSRHAYDVYLSEERQKKPENKKLSEIIIKTLKELEKNQSWLAKQIGVSRQVVSNYTHAKIMPRKPVLEKIFSALELPYKTLEDLTENN